jgi:hypothetical protein
MTGRVYRWRIRPAAEPDRVSAELVFMAGPDGDSGELEVLGDDPAMRVLVLYYLSDVRDLRPVYVHGVGQLKGPHTRSAEQLDLSIMEFGRSFPAFAAERVPGVASLGPPPPDPGSLDAGEPPAPEPAAIEHPRAEPAVLEPRADLRFLVDDLMKERGISAELAVDSLFRAIAAAQPLTPAARDSAELFATDSCRGVSLLFGSETPGHFRRRALGGLLWTLELLERTVEAAANSLATSAAPRLERGATTAVPPSLIDLMSECDAITAALGSAAAAIPELPRKLGALTVCWRLAWEMAVALAAEVPVPVEVERALAASLHARCEEARASLAPWTCFAERSCGDLCPRCWHLRDEREDEVADALRWVAERALLLPQ